MLEGGLNVPRLLAALQGVFKITRGGRGGGAQRGGNGAEEFDPSEPAWETGDDRANLEGSQGCSNLVPA